MRKYDIVVVGGGPGGTLAAKTAAEKGLKVLVVERGKEIGDKIVSGAIVLPKMFRDFPFTRTMDLPRARIPSASHLGWFEPPPSYETVYYTVTAMNPEQQQYPTQCVYMKELVGFFADTAKGAGAEFQMSTLVTDVLRKDGKIAGIITDKDGEIQSDIVIAADGVLSLVARKAGLRQKWDPWGVVNLASLTFSAPAERIAEEEIGGGVWSIIGLGANYHCVFKDGFHIGGFGFPACTLGRRVQSRRGVAADFLKFLEPKPIKDMLKRLDAKPVEFSMHPLTWFDEMPKEIYTDGLMLVGDAAGVPEPFLASGIYEAMYSGRLAAEVAAEAIENGNTSKGFLKVYYDRLEASPVGQQFVGGKQVRAMFDLLLTDPEGRKIVDLMRFMMLLVWGAWSGTIYPASVTVPLMVPAFIDRLPIMGKVLGLYLPLVSPALSEPLSRLAGELAGGMMKGFMAKGGE
jgi:flavin-dependent dehydrogenase